MLRSMSACRDPNGRKRRRSGGLGVPLWPSVYQKELRAFWAEVCDRFRRRRKVLMTVLPIRLSSSDRLAQRSSTPSRVRLLQSVTHATFDEVPWGLPPALEADSGGEDNFPAGRPKARGDHGLEIQCRRRIPRAFPMRSPLQAPGPQSGGFPR